MGNTANCTSVEGEEKFLPICCPGRGGILIPELTDGSNRDAAIGGAVIYLILILWAFAAVGVISDTFMEAIEIITSQKKEILWEENGVKKKTRVKIWNSTVANLTLMALGSSAPEIMLAVIEIMGNEMFAGLLGPSTIVGSAAFNFFMISSVCISAFWPKDEIRRIEGIKVYMTTCTFSLLAYLWMLIVLQVFSPDRVDFWEAMVTFLLFPVLVGASYAMDQDVCFKRMRRPEDHEVSDRHVRYVDSRTATDHGDDGEVKPMNQKGGVGRLTMHTMSLLRQEFSRGEEEPMSAELQNHLAGKQCSSDFIPQIRAQMRNEIGLEALQNVPDEALLKYVMRNVDKFETPQKRSKAYYRSMHKKDAAHKKNAVTKFDESMASNDDFNQHQPLVDFEYDEYFCLECAGSQKIKVHRTDETKDHILQISYKTVDGADIDDSEKREGAKAGVEYHEAVGTLTFEAGELEKEITVAIIDNDVPNRDKFFFIELVDVQCETWNSTVAKGRQVTIGQFARSEITIIDDDIVGTLEFNFEKVVCTEGKDAVAEIFICRKNGCKGELKCSFSTRDAKDSELGDDSERSEKKAVADVDYTPVKDAVLKFAEGEAKSSIKIPLKQPHDEATRVFAVDIQHCKDSECEFSKGHSESCLITIQPDPERAQKVAAFAADGAKFEELMRKRDDDGEEEVGTYGQQLCDIFSIEGEDDDDEGGWANASCRDKISCVLMSPWKLIFALVPPSKGTSGYKCFFGSLLAIGFVTAVVGDLASLLGCALGISDDITAITLVALGTSLPDTFASQTAAVQEEDADDCIGNITGSNSVNVFLGLGLPWLIGSIYWGLVIENVDTRNDERWARWNAQPVVAGGKETYETYFVDSGIYPGGGFMTPAGTLGFSVMIYTILACVGVVFFYIRRRVVGGELGGDPKIALISSFLFASLWFIYIGVSIWKSQADAAAA